MDRSESKEKAIAVDMERMDDFKNKLGFLGVCLLSQVQISEHG